MRFIYEKEKSRRPPPKPRKKYLTKKKAGKKDSGKHKADLVKVLTEEESRAILIKQIVDQTEEDLIFIAEKPGEGLLNNTLTKLLIVHDDDDHDYNTPASLLERIKTFAEFLKIDKTLTSLDLRFEPGEEGSKIIAEALKENHTITYLYFGHDITAKSVGTKAFFKTLKVNKTITELSLMLSRIGAEEAKALAEALKVNKTHTSFSYMNDHNTEKMLEQRQQLGIDKYLQRNKDLVTELAKYLTDNFTPKKESKMDLTKETKGLPVKELSIKDFTALKFYTHVDKGLLKEKMNKLNDDYSSIIRKVESTINKNFLSVFGVCKPITTKCKAYVKSDIKATIKSLPTELIELIGQFLGFKAIERDTLPRPILFSEPTEFDIYAYSSYKTKFDPSAYTSYEIAIADGFLDLSGAEHKDSTMW